MMNFVRRGILFVIVAVGGQTITDSDELIQEIEAARIGTPITLTLYREGQRMTLAVVPARRAIPLPNRFTWRGATLAHADWEVCWTHKLPVDVKGLVVTDLQAGSAAEQAGLKVGAVVIQIGDARVPCIRRLPQITRDLKGPVKVVLGGTPAKEVTVP